MLFRSFGNPGRSYYARELIRLAAGGRANLFSTEDCCVLVDDELLRQINCTSSVVIATSLNFTFAKAGTRIATVKSVKPHKTTLATRCATRR